MNNSDPSKISPALNVKKTISFVDQMYIHV